MKKYAITLTVLMLLLAPLVIYTQTLADDEQSGPGGNDEQSDPSNTGAGDNSTSTTAPGDGDDTPSIGTGAVDDRNWGGAEELTKHQDFVLYVANEWPDNILNNKLVEENTRLYNIETAIGHDVDTLYVAALAAKKSSLSVSYSPTDAQSKLHEALFQLYTVPSTDSELDEALARVVNGTHSDYYVSEIAKSIDALADVGIAHKNVDAKDPDFWAQLAAESLCEEIVDCSVEDLRNAVSGVPSTHTIGQPSLDNSEIRTMTNFGLHFATLTMRVTPCEAPNDICWAYTPNYGSGIRTSTVVSDWHIAADPIPTRLTNYGLNGNNEVVAIGKVIEVLEGDPTRVDDDDGYVNVWVSLDNPNGRAASIPTLQLESFAHQ